MKKLKEIVAALAFGLVLTLTGVSSVAEHKSLSEYAPVLQTNSPLR